MKKINLIKRLLVTVLAVAALTACAFSEDSMVDIESENEAQESDVLTENQMETDQEEALLKEDIQIPEKPESKVSVEENPDEQNFTAEDGTVLLHSWYQDMKITIKDNDAAAQKMMDELAAQKANYKEIEAETLDMAQSDYQARMEDSFIGYSLSHYYQVTRNDANVISFQMYEDSYSGGAHGSYDTRGVNFDVTTGEKLTIDTIADDADALRKASKEEIIRQAAEMPEDHFFDAVNSQKFADSIDSIIAGDAWYFTKSGIKFIANIYELSPYAVGATEFTVPYDMLTGLKENYKYNGGFMLEVPNGRSVIIDLDGDGTEEEVKFTGEMNYETYENEFSLLVNGTDLTSGITGEGTFYSENMLNAYAIVDLDSSDEYKELAIMDNGPSNDPVTYFFRYDGSKFVLMGNINDLVTSDTTTMFKNGQMLASLRISLLETAYTEALYQVDENGKLVLVPLERYEIFQYSGETANHVHEILQDVTVYRENSLEADKVTLTQADGPVTFPATDNQHWVEVETQDGKLYYLYLNDFGTINSDEKQLNVPEVFDNIFLAD